MSNSTNTFGNLLQSYLDKNAKTGVVPYSSENINNPEFAPPVKKVAPVKDLPPELQGVVDSTKPLTDTQINAINSIANPPDAISAASPTVNPPAYSQDLRVDAISGAAPTVNTASKAKASKPTTSPSAETAPPPIGRLDSAAKSSLGTSAVQGLGSDVGPKAPVGNFWNDLVKNLFGNQTFGERLRTLGNYISGTPELAPVYTQQMQQNILQQMKVKNEYDQKLAQINEFYQEKLAHATTALQKQIIQKQLDAALAQLDRQAQNAIYELNQTLDQQIKLRTAELRATTNPGSQGQ